MGGHPTLQGITMKPVFEKLTDRQLEVWEKTAFPELQEAAGHIRQCYAQGIRQMDWKGIDSIPATGVFLVCLENEMLGTYIHVMTRFKLGDGSPMVTIGGNFAFDCPRPVQWMDIDFPEGKEPR